MLKALIKKEISEILYRLFRRGGRGKKDGKVRKTSGKGFMILLLVLALYLVAIFAVFAVSLCFSIAEIGMGWLYFLILAGGAVLFGTLGSVFSTCFTLYMAKDNDLLLSMPIPVKYVILSRLLSVYLLGLLYSGMISIPAVVVYLAVIGFSIPALLGGLVYILLISLVVLGLSCLLGWAVAKVMQRLKNRSFLTVLIALLFIVLYYVVYFRIMNHTKDLLAGVIAFGGRMEKQAPLIYLLGRVGEGDWLGMLAWTGIVGAFIGLLWVLLKKTFLSIATSTPTPKRAVYREKTARQGSPNIALLRKELRRFTASANYMLNCGLGMLILPAVGIYLLVKGKTLLLTLSMAFSTPGIASVGLGAICCILSSMMDISAPSVSLEGKSLWQVQCLPVTPWQVLRAKLTAHLALAAVPTVIWAVCVVIAAPDEPVLKLLMLAISLFAVLWVALLGLTLGVKMPNLTWSNEIVPIKQSATVIITIFSGFVLGLAVFGFYILFGAFIGATVYLSIVAALLLCADVLLWLWLRSRGAKHFAEL